MLQEPFLRTSLDAGQQLAEEIGEYIKRTESMPEQRNRILFRTEKGTDFDYGQLAGLFRDFYEEIVPQYYTVVQHGGHLEEKEMAVYRRTCVGGRDRQPQQRKRLPILRRKTSIIWGK